MFGRHDPNTASDQSEHDLYTCWEEGTLEFGIEFEFEFELNIFRFF